MTEVEILHFIFVCLFVCCFGRVVDHDNVKISFHCQMDFQEGGKPMADD